MPSSVVQNVAIVATAFAVSANAQYSQGNSQWYGNMRQGSRGSRGNRGSMMRQWGQGGSEGVASSSGNTDWMETLKARIQDKMAAKKEERADQIAALSVACSEEIASCNLPFTPESVFTEVLAFKSSQKAAGTRDPLPEDIQSKQEALKECFQSMKEELSALSEESLPEENSCIAALKASRKHGKGKHGKGKHGKGKQLCADESRPACSDGQKPTFNRETMTIVCSDGISTPLCADGSAPEIPEDGFRGKGKHGKGKKLCADESRPACSDGQKPSFNRETMTIVCSDGISTPLCADGSAPEIPEDGFRGKVQDKLKQLCPDESRPACFDGQKPTFNRETMTMVCSDGISTPLCADGSAPQIPEGGFRGRGKGQQRGRGEGSQQQGVFGRMQMSQMGQQMRQRGQQGGRNGGQKPWSNFGSQFGSNFGGVYYPQP